MPKDEEDTTKKDRVYTDDHGGESRYFNPPKPLKKEDR